MICLGGTLSLFGSFGFHIQEANYWFPPRQKPLVGWKFGVRFCPFEIGRNEYGVASATPYSPFTV